MAVVFLDTETTGTHRGYRPWEVAIIRRESSGAESSITIFIDVDDLDLPNADPQGLQIGGFGHRHPQNGGALQAGQVLCRGDEAAALVRQWTDSALVFGVNPSFDTICLDALLDRAGLSATWYYVPQDIAAIAYGFVLKDMLSPPRSTEPLSQACGVEVPGPADRHTAMGDALWVQRWYDSLHARGCVDLL